MFQTQLASFLKSKQVKYHRMKRKETLSLQLLLLLSMLSQTSWLKRTYLFIQMRGIAQKWWWEIKWRKMPYTKDKWKKWESSNKKWIKLMLNNRNTNKRWIWLNFNKEWLNVLKNGNKKCNKGMKIQIDLTLTCKVLSLLMVKLLWAVWLIYRLLERTEE